MWLLVFFSLISFVSLAFRCYLRLLFILIILEVLHEFNFISWLIHELFINFGRAINPYLRLELVVCYFIIVEFQAILPIIFEFQAILLTMVRIIVKFQAIFLAMVLISFFTLNFRLESVLALMKFPIFI